MSETSLLIITHLQRRMGKKIEALKAYENPFPEGDIEIQRMREIEAIKLRHEVSVLSDLIDVVSDMFPRSPVPQSPLRHPNPPAPPRKKRDGNDKK